jgi:hypothetical protein
LSHLGTSQELFIIHLRIIHSRDTKVYLSSNFCLPTPLVNALQGIIFLPIPCLPTDWSSQGSFCRHVKGGGENLGQKARAPWWSFTGALRLHFQVLIATPSIGVKK